MFDPVLAKSLDVHHSSKCFLRQVSPAFIIYYHLYTVQWVIIYVYIYISISLSPKMYWIHSPFEIVAPKIFRGKCRSRHGQSHRGLLGRGSSPGPISGRGGGRVLRGASSLASDGGWGVEVGIVQWKMWMKNDENCGK